jgi:telomerase Cajal body protein 1
VLLSSMVVDQEWSSSDSSSSIKLLAKSTDVNGEGNFFQGCSFSPDGLCVLTHTVADGKLRLYNTHTSTQIPPSQPNDTCEAQGLGETSTIHHWKTILSSNGGDAVRCYSWYPLMTSADPGTCCFIAAARYVTHSFFNGLKNSSNILWIDSGLSDQPVHLYDAYVADHVRASYRPYNALDEMEAPNVVEFSKDGQRIFCAGFRTDRTIHVFDTAIPGRDSTLLRFGKTRRSRDGQKGLVSALGMCGSSMVAVGTYAPGSIYIYDIRTGQPSGTILDGTCVVGHGKGHCRKKRRFAGSGEDPITEGFDNDGTLENDNWFTAAKGKWFQSKAQGGITQLQFAPNQEFMLYSASRRSNAIIAWDLRMLSGLSEYQSHPIRGFASYETVNDTNQRLEFDFDDEQTLYVGGQDLCVRLYDITTGKCQNRIIGLDDSVNGVSRTCLHGRSLLAVATGARRFPSVDSPDDPTIQTSTAMDPPGYLRLYDVTDCHRDVLRLQ